MASCPEQYDELAELLTAVSDTGLSAPQARRLAELMRNDPAVKQLYLDFVELDTMLVWQHKEGRDGHAPCEVTNHQLPESTRGEWNGVIGAISVAPVASPIPHSSSPSVSPFFIDTTLPSPFPPPRYAFIDSPWFAFLLAGVIVGAGLAIAAMWKMPDHSQMASSQSMTDSLRDDDVETDTDEQPSLSDKTDPSSSSLPPRIGQITDMVDCRWSDSRTEVFNGASVPLGRKYALSSGLMEITYDTGAKVILQGPCTYEAESETGGYLSLGKLTARVEKGPRSKAQGPGTAEVASGQWSVVSGRKSKIQNPKSKISSPQPLAPSPSSNSSLSTLPSPLFTIKTPTAMVTDLGTEFGVQVLEDGRSEVHVLQGLVEAKFVDAGTNGDQKVRVAAGEAVRLDRTHLAIERVDADPAVFVRAMTRRVKASPTVMVADNFAYPDGPLAGNNGGTAGTGSFWSGAWFRGGLVAGGQAALAESSVSSRMLHPAISGSSTQPIYFSARFTKTGNNPKYVSCLQLVANSNDVNDNYDDAMIGLTSDWYRVTLSEAATRRVRYDDFGDYTPGQQVLIVGKLEFNVDGANDRLQAWINPTGVETADVVSPQIMMDLGWTSPRCVHLRNWTGPTGTCFVSDVRIGYTWDAVAGPNNTSTSKEDLPMEQ